MPPDPLMPRLERLISAFDICQRIGFTRQTLRRLCKQGLFPQPLHVSRGRVAWREREVEEWLANGGVVGARRKPVPQT
jgi:predicted DNA-binding transcriptional regulator AlpA